jgi:predicted ATPase
MRTARAKDYWKTSFNRNYENFVSSIDLNGIGGIDKVDFKKGIFAICGLNGAGKSTIISALKDVLGIKINKQDEKKIGSIKVTGQITSTGEQYDVSNEENFRFPDISGVYDSLNYLDYKQSIVTLEFLEQDNLEELLEQFDQNVLSDELIKDLTYVVGKKYDKVTLIEVEDGEETYPYFKVETSQVHYDSLGMGIGEHFLFYIFWVFYRMKKTGIILIEEPETFISITSQVKLMDFIAKKTSELGVTVITATHSPYIIKNIKKENIIVLSRFANHVSILKPRIDRDSLTSLGLETPKVGTIFVEDYVAELFIKALLSKNSSSILKDFSIESVDGHAEISKRLKFPDSKKFAYKIIGIYDGDVKAEVEKVKNKLNWVYCFLPTEDAIEADFKECVTNDVDRFSKLVQIDKNNIIQILASIDGEDHHDWLIELARQLGKDIPVVVDKLYEIWEEKEDRQRNINEFVIEIEKICYNSAS